MCKNHVNDAMINSCFYSEKYINTFASDNLDIEEIDENLSRILMLGATQIEGENEK